MLSKDDQLDVEKAVEVDWRHQRNRSRSRARAIDRGRRKQAGKAFKGVMAEHLQRKNHMSQAQLNVSILQELSQEILAQLEDSLEQVHISAGSAIVTKGEIGDAMYFLDGGTATLAILDVDGTALSRVYEPGEHFGELALLNDEPRQATVLAGPDGATVLKLDRTIFNKITRTLEFKGALEAPQQSKLSAPCNRFGCAYYK